MASCAVLGATLALWAGATLADTGRAVPPAPAADHHQHVFSPAAAAWMSAATGSLRAVMADELVADLDAAGIGRAAVLSVAYVYGNPERTIDDEYERVRDENDWAAAQAARYPDRLVALCSFNPLRDYALLELARCASSPGFGRGIKLHFGHSDVQLDDPEHLVRMRQVFRAANARGMAIVVHLRGGGPERRAYAVEQARLLMEQVLPFAPDVPVQVAQVAPSAPRPGSAAPAPTYAAMAVLAEAAARRDPRVRQVWFDLSSVTQAELPPADARRLVRRLREAGLERVLYGSHAAPGDALAPPDGWAAFLRLPLTEAEASRVARNVAPYLR